MESQSPGSVPPAVARSQLRAASQAGDASARRATPGMRVILALSVFCGAQTIAPAYKGPGDLVSIIAIGWFLAEILAICARNHWRPLLSLPKPKWSGTEVTLICFAVLVGGEVGPHVLASRTNSAVASWGLGAGVAVIVAACLLAATVSYRHRSSRGWQP